MCIANGRATCLAVQAHGYRGAMQRAPYPEFTTDKATKSEGNDDVPFLGVTAGIQTWPTVPRGRQTEV